MRKKLERLKICLYVIFVAIIFLFICSLGEHLGNDEYWLTTIIFISDLLKIVIILCTLIGIDPLIDLLTYLYEKNKED